MSYQRDYQRRLKAGIVGVGSHCYRNILPVMNFLPVELKAMSDVNEEAVRQTAEQYGCNAYTSSKEMYEKEALDVVFICVGPKLHPALVIEALDAGVHVWVEKPISVRASQVEEMIAHRKDRIVVVGLKKAFMPACQKAEEVIGSPEYGGLRSLLAVYPMTIEENGEELLEAGETPNWLRNGVHPLAFLMQLGGKVHSVTALTGPYGNGAVVLQFQSGVMGTLHLASGSQPDRESYGIFGDGWSMQIEDTAVKLQRGDPSFAYRDTSNFAPPGFDGGAIVWNASNCLATLENKALFTQGFFAETKYFCDCVLENRTPSRGTLEFAHEIMMVYEAGFRSHGKTVLL